MLILGFILNNLQMNKDTLIKIGLASIGVYIIYSFAYKKDVQEEKEDIKSILFVGDSITQPVPNVYSTLIKNKLQPNGIKVDILAVKGKTTSWMLTNLKDKLSKNKYDLVYIYGGVNDIFSGIKKDVALSNLQKMVDLINVNKSKPYVITGYDSTKFMDVNKLKKNGYASKYKPNYIDYQNSIKPTIKNAEVINKIDISSLTSDGIHPNSLAHQLIANKILETIKKEIQ